MQNTTATSYFLVAPLPQSRATSLAVQLIALWLCRRWR